MTTVVTRIPKGSPLTWLEEDTNFNNLNNDKLETVGVTTTSSRITTSGSPVTTSDGTGGNIALDLATTAVTPASYTNTSLTVDAYGRITSASSGSGAGTPASPTNSVQYNNAGSFGGSAEVLMNPATSLITLGATASWTIEPLAMATADTAGLNLSINSGDGNGSEPGGNLNLSTGLGDAAESTTLSGNVNISTGGGSGLGNGYTGSIFIQPGTATGNAGAGNVQVFGGDAPNNSGGSVSIAGGDSIDSNAGAVFINGGTSTNLNGGSVIIAGGEVGGEIQLNSRTTTAIPDEDNAGFNLPHGAAPDTPTNGDIWTTTAGLFVRINGVTLAVQTT